MTFVKMPLAEPHSLSGNKPNRLPVNHVRTSRPNQPLRNTSRPSRQSVVSGSITNRPDRNSLSAPHDRRTTSGSRPSSRLGGPLRKPAIDVRCLNSPSSGNEEVDIIQHVRKQKLIGQEKVLERLQSRFTPFVKGHNGEQVKVALHAPIGAG